MYLYRLIYVISYMYDKAYTVLCVKNIETHILINRK